MTQHDYHQGYQTTMRYHLAPDRIVIKAKKLQVTKGGKWEVLVEI